MDTIPMVLTTKSTFMSLFMWFLVTDIRTFCKGSMLGVACKRLEPTHEHHSEHGAVEQTACHRQCLYMRQKISIQCVICWWQ